MKPPFLNGSRSPVRLRVPFGKDQKRVAFTERVRASGDRRERLLAGGTIDGHEPGDIEGGAHDRELPQLRFVEDLEPRVQRLEQHRRVHVAFVVRTVHDGRSWHIFAAADLPPDSCQRQCQTHATVPQPIQAVRRSQHDPDEQTDRAGNGNVGQGHDIRDHGADDEHQGWHSVQKNARTIRPGVNLRVYVARTRLRGSRGRSARRGGHDDGRLDGPWRPWPAPWRVQGCEP